MNNMWLRIQISFVFIVFFMALVVCILLFPIAYWIFALSPDKIADWAFYKVNYLEAKMKYRKKAIAKEKEMTKESDPSYPTRFGDAVAEIYGRKKDE